MDACSIVGGVDVSTDVSNDYVEAFEPCGAQTKFLGFFDGGRESGAANTAGVGQ